MFAYLTILCGTRHTQKNGECFKQKKYEKNEYLSSLSRHEPRLGLCINKDDKIYR